jgi:hypothetical protein
MRISELILQLKAIKHQWGDLEVFSKEHSGLYTEVEEPLVRSVGRYTDGLDGYFGTDEETDVRDAVIL